MKIEFCHGEDCKRERLCRWCNTKILIGEPSYKMFDFHVNGKYCSIFFHDKCWDNIRNRM